jgi:hypothetical protein
LLTYVETSSVGKSNALQDIAAGLPIACGGDCQ